MTDQDLIERRFVVILRSAIGPIESARIADAKMRAETISKNRCDLLFTSQDASVMGLIITTDWPPKKIVSEIDKSLDVKDRGFILVLSVNKEWAAMGNSSGWRHVQKHWLLSNFETLPDGD